MKILKLFGFVVAVAVVVGLALFGLYAIYFLTHLQDMFHG